MKLLQLSAATFALAALAAGSAQAQAPVNDICTGAINLASSFGGALNTAITTGPYDNTNATIGADDPTTGYQCFGEPTGNGASPSLDNTLWYTFVGDGNIYYIETNACNPAVSNYIDDGDTQIAIYSGSCGSLTPVACNEDMPNPPTNPDQYPAGLNFQTTAGTTYYMIIDGFKLGTAASGISRGEFCVSVTKLPTIQCNDASVSPGTPTASATAICPGDTLFVTSTGVVSPNIGAAYGVSWIISSAPITGSTDPLGEPSLVASYNVSNPAPSTSTRQLVNDGGLIGTANAPYGTYYWTPVVFGNATHTDPTGNFLSNYTLVPTCTFTGTSVAVNFRAPGDPACATVITCNDPTVTVGTATAASPCILAGQNLSVTSSGVVAPNVPTAGGTWVISSADISGSSNPKAEPSYIGSFNIANPVPASSVLNFANNNQIPPGTYYVTRVIFGNSTTTTTPPTSLAPITLDPACTFTGQSIMFVFKAQGETCQVGVADLVKGGFYINNIYPVPVANILNLEVAAEYDSKVVVTVKDMLGREVSAHNFNATAGENNKYSISLDGESAGVYFVTVSNGRHIAVSKFVKE